MFQTVLTAAHAAARRNTDTAARLMFSQDTDGGAATARELYRVALRKQFDVSAYLTRRSLRR